MNLRKDHYRSIVFFREGGTLEKSAVERPMERIANFALLLSINVKRSTRSSFDARGEVASSPDSDDDERTLTKFRRVCVARVYARVPLAANFHSGRITVYSPPRMKCKARQPRSHIFVRASLSSRVTRTERRVSSGERIEENPERWITWLVGR